MSTFNLLKPSTWLLLCAVTAASGESPADLREFISRYASDREALSRTYDTSVSPSADDRMKKFHTDSLEALHRIDFASLDQEGKVDYILLQNHLTHIIRQQELTRIRTQEMTPLLPFAPVIVNLDQARRRMEQVQSEQAARDLTKIVKQVEQLRKSLELGLDPNMKQPAGAPPVQPLKADRIVARRSVTTIGKLRESLKIWFKYYDGYDPQFTWWVAQPYQETDKALDEYGKFLTEKVVGIKPDDKTTIVGDPAGREALMLELADAMIPYAPEELIAIGKTEMAWCQREMMRASRDMGYGDDWHKALEHVKGLHVEPGRQPEMIRQLAVEATDYVEKNDLVTVPPLAKEVWRMEMMSPEQQLINPFFLGGEVIQVSYPTNTMTYEQRMMSMRGNNRPFARATVFHELIPGHHLQGFMAERYRSYRQIFDNPFWIEGNAFYWEMLLWDMGFPKTPEERVGMLFWRMHRCARVIFSLSFHLGQMTAPQCVDYLVENVGHERDNAGAEVRRSFESYYSPIYQSAYLLGALQFRSLRKESVDSGKMTNRAFHDAILQGNYMPVDLVRVRLTDQVLTPDYRSTWRFYGDPK